MGKTRARFGEKYWYVVEYAGDFTTASAIDYYEHYDDDLFESGNYFLTEEEAESMARKLRAVLAGAEVIKMPSGEEIKERLDMILPTQPVESWCVEGYCKHIIGLILSKIVK